MFINEMQKTLNDDFNYNVTENGALGYCTTGKALLDINFKVASLRSASESEIVDLFMKAFYENKELAMKWLFFIRDIHGGLGERRLFRVISEYLCINNPDIMHNLIQYIPEYGRYDDMWGILDTQLQSIVIDFIRNQLSEDLANYYHNRPISLTAKWLPSINTSSKETVKRARQFVRLMGNNEKSYRKTISMLRKYIDVVECKMSANEWDDVRYETVPSKANLIYRNAFLRHDETRRREYLDALKKGKTKINAGVLYPHEIVNNYLPNYSRSPVMKNEDITLEELWKALPNTINENGNTIVVADGSGSMFNTIGNSNVTALSVANALAIYFSERSIGQFKDKYITFSETPQLVNFSGCDSLRDKIELALRNNQVANTNIEAVFNLILKTAINGNMKQGDIPQNILIISDCEFDEQVDGNPDQRLFSVIADRYEQAGYKLPRLVFWNVNSRTGMIPVIENDLGVALVSGFSVNIVKMVLSGELDPYKCLVEQLMSERYEKITVG